MHSSVSAMPENIVGNHFRKSIQYCCHITLNVLKLFTITPLKEVFSFGNMKQLPYQVNRTDIPNLVFVFWPNNRFTESVM
jgi:hypothetical protein